MFGHKGKAIITTTPPRSADVAAGITASQKAELDAIRGTGAEIAADALKTPVNQYLEALRSGHRLKSRIVKVGKDRFDLRMSTRFVMVNSRNIWALRSLADYYRGFEYSTSIGEKNVKIPSAPPSLCIGPPGT